MRVVLPLLCALSLLCAADDPAPLIALARTSAPEFFADAVIKLVQAGRLPTRDLQKVLLEDAFTAAATVGERFPMSPFIFVRERRMEMAPGAGATVLGFDTLSLRSRVVIEMSSIEPGRARELFATIAKPSWSARACDETLVADPGLYYDAMVTAAPVETGHGELVRFLQTEISRMESPLESRGIVRVIQSAPFTSWQRVLFTWLIADRLRNIRAARYCPGPGDPSLPPLRPAYEKSEDPESVSEAFRRLQLMPGGGPRFDEDKSTPEWTGLLTDFLRVWESWQPTGSAVDAFHQKASFLLRVLNATPGSDNRDRVLQFAAYFLATFGIERRKPAEWLWRVRSFDKAAGANRARFRALLRESGNVDLALFVALSEIH